MPNGPRVRRVEPYLTLKELETIDKLHPFGPCFLLHHMASYPSVPQPARGEIPAPTSLTPSERATYAAAILQVHAMFALDDFEPDAQSRAIDAAVIAGRVGPEQLRQELMAYAREKKTMKGFIESRSWAVPHRWPSL